MSSTPSSCVRLRSLYGAARVTMACRSSTAHSSITVVATSCWARTSSGWRGTRVCSIAPSRMRPTTTAVSSRSPRYLGKKRPELAVSTWWPARPTRWRPAATDFGDSTWTTRSIAPMSIPSSSDDVATSAGSRPVFSISSISSRCSRAIEPWWARAISSSARSFRRWATRSAARRLFTKTSVERWARTSSSRRG